MKKNFFKTMGKTLMIALLGISLVTLTGCPNNQTDDPTPEPTPTPTPGPNPDPTPGPNPDPTPGPSTSGDSWAYLLNETQHEAVVNGNTLTYGDHVYTVNGEINLNETNFQSPTAYVTFTNIPSGYTEFEAVYNGLLGKSMQGAAAMIPMAIEMYARDATLGERCLNLLCNSSTTVSGITRILKTKFNYSQYSPENDLYVQRFLPAATLKGAAYNNAYTPIDPYTVEMCRSANAPQQTQLFGYGTVYYLYILAPGGWDTFQRSVEIYKADGTDIYKVYNCPAVYTQCKNIIGAWQGLK